MFKHGHLSTSCARLSSLLLSRTLYHGVSPKGIIPGDSSLSKPTHLVPGTCPSRQHACVVGHRFPLAHSCQLFPRTSQDRTRKTEREVNIIFTRDYSTPPVGKCSVAPTTCEATCSVCCNTVPSRNTWTTCIPFKLFCGILMYQIGYDYSNNHSRPFLAVPCLAGSPE